MLDAGGVKCFLSLLSSGRFESPATQNTCVVVLYGLSYERLRFKGLAKEAGAEETLTKLLREKHEEEEEEEDVNWEELLNSDDDLSRTQSRIFG